MEYKGKLYGHLGNRRYFDTGKTADDWDNLEKRIAELEAENKALRIHGVGWQSEQLPEFDVQEINEILQDCKEKKEDLMTLIGRIWNKGYMTAVYDEREG